MNCLESCWTGLLEALNHWVQMDFNFNQISTVCNKHRRMLFDFSAIFKSASCSIVCCIYYIFFSSLDKISMPQSVNRKMGNHKEPTGKLFKLTVSLSKLPESLDLDNGLIDLGTTEVYRKCMYSKCNQSSWQTVKTSKKQKYTQRNKHQDISQSVHVESRQNSQNRRMYSINIYCCC